jgi:pyruvate/2-oxoglutarate dehydrogenase complex dihydrolipoamide dehydrogenase (E3) component
LLLYTAELLSLINKANEFGIDVKIKRIDFSFIMERMRNIINREIEQIKRALKESPNIDYYQ